MGTWGPFLGGKARPGRDTDHSPPSNAEVVNEQGLYFLSPQAPPWRVAGLLYFLCPDILIKLLRLRKLSYSLRERRRLAIGWSLLLLRERSGISASKYKYSL
jgi:hypothetical protein